MPSDTDHNPMGKASTATVPSRVIRVERRDGLSLVRTAARRYMSRVGAGNAFGWSVTMLKVDIALCGGGAGASKPDVARVGLAVVGVVQAAWRYWLMSPSQVGCRRIGWPGR